MENKNFQKRYFRSKFRSGYILRSDITTKRDWFYSAELLEAFFSIFSFLVFFLFSEKIQKSKERKARLTLKGPSLFDLAPFTVLLGIE